MKNLIAFTIAFTLTCLSSSAQPKLILKNQLSPYDSGVVIDLPQYRVIRHKITTADVYIESLKKQVDSLNRQMFIMDDLFAKLNTLDSAQESRQQRNETAFKDLNRSFDKLLTEATKPKKWYEKPWVYVAGGVLTGWILTR